MDARRAGIGFALLGALCLPLLSGCGGEEGTSSGNGKADEKKPTTEGKKGTEAAKPAPVQKSWAAQAFDAYQDAMRETVALLDKAPAPADALPKLRAIRDKYVEILVPLGKEREAMAPAARAQADAQLSMKLGSVDPEAFKGLQKLCNETYPISKMKTDEEKEFNKLLTGMNIITQYANFELLKKQEPKEAERLGIK